MKLYYRGLSYELNFSQIASQKTEKPSQPVFTIHSAYNLTYRGVTYHIDPNAKQKEVRNPLVTHELMYRGIPYNLNSNSTEM
ncbi:MAG: DUF4278 domain-containing protein [Komarekiella atlantica HA4396-MV6]|jgi:hypothetical protein|nr:DUF4278 domain-containing protein [Komarekiella atlantica HA4396-MV6]